MSRRSRLRISLAIITERPVAGVLVNIVSSVRHVRVVRALNSGQPIVTKPSTLAIIVALVLAAGLATAVYLSRELAAKRTQAKASSVSRASIKSKKHCIAW